MYFCFLFYSRNNALKFLDELKKSQLKASLISTPKILKRGCGVSVKAYELNKAKTILTFKHYPSFYGILQANQTPNGTNYTKLE